MSADNWADCPQCGRGDALREDYELGIVSGGKFYVIYKGECRGLSACGFKFEYRYEQKLEVKPA